MANQLVYLRLMESLYAHFTHTTGSMHMERVVGSWTDEYDATQSWAVSGGNARTTATRVTGTVDASSTLMSSSFENRPQFLNCFYIQRVK